jgi:archaellum biogenesis ATPase FlaH
MSVYNKKDDLSWIKECIRNSNSFEEAIEFIETANETFNIRSKQTQKNQNTMLEKPLGEELMFKLSEFVLKPKEYIIERLNISKGDLVLLVGTGSSGKTMLAQYFASCVSSGSKIFGKFATNKGNVIHVDQEFNDYNKRYYRLANGLDLKELEIKVIRFNTRLDAKKFNNKNLSEQDVESYLEEKFSGSDFIIIDSLKACSEADENSSDIRNVLDLLKKIAVKLNCAIMVIHHKGKGRDAKQSGRGHSSIYDACDVQIDLDSNKEIYEISCTKMREGKYFTGFTYELRDEGEIIDGQNFTKTLKLKLSIDELPNRRQAKIEKVKNHLSEKGETNQSVLVGLIGGDTSAAIDLLHEMIEKGIISKKDGKGKAKIYYLSK